MSTPHHSPEVELPQDTDEVFEVDSETILEEVSGASTQFMSGPNTVPQGGN